MKEVKNTKVCGEATATATTGKVPVKVNDEIANLTLEEYWTEWLQIPEQHLNERDWDEWFYDTSDCVIDYIDDDEIADYMYDKMGGDIEITKIYKFVQGECCRLEYRYVVDGCNYRPDTKMSVIINEIYNKVICEDIGDKVA
jgi:hypothetical protein